MHTDHPKSESYNTLHIITAVHNRYSITEKFVDSLKQQTFQSFQLILVDDGSTDGTDKMVREKLPNSVILYGNGSLWWGGALHKAYKYINTQNINPDDYILIINDDTNLKNNFLETGVNLLQKNPNTFIPAVGYSVNDGSVLDGAVYWDFRTGDNVVLEPNESGNCASTRALFFRVKDFLAVGGFHPILLPHYGSDYEFTIRAARKGYRIQSFSELSFSFDEKSTGDRIYTRYSAKEFLKRMFSKRSSFNPIYKLNLLILVTPFPFILKTIYCQTKTVLSNFKKKSTHQNAEIS